MKKLLLMCLLAWSAPGLTEDAASTVVYVTDQLRLQMLADKGQGEVVKTLRSGDRLTILESSPQFYRVVTDDGIEGWVKKHYTEEQPPAAARIKALEEQLAAEPAELAQRDAIIERLNRELSALQTQLDKKRVGEGLTEEYEQQLVAANQENVQLFNEKEQLRKQLTQAELKVLHGEQSLRELQQQLDQVQADAQPVVTEADLAPDMPLIAEPGEAAVAWLPLLATGGSALMLGLFFGRLLSGRRS